MLKYFILFLVSGSFFMMIVMRKTGEQLKTQSTPYGIIDLELAKSSARARTVIKAWENTDGTDRIVAARLNTELDFLFICFYAVFLNQACKGIAGCYQGFAKTIGLLIAAGAIAAGLFDIFENIGMLFMLQGYINDGVALFTFSFSITKWMLVVTALGYLIAGGLFQVLRQLTKT